MAILSSLWIVACVTVPLPAPSASVNDGPTGTPLEPSISEEPSPLGAWLDLPVAVDSRDLLEVIEPGEQITADVSLARPADLATAATAVGLAAEASPPDVVSIRGTMVRVHNLLQGRALWSVTVSEDDRALRWIPEARPVVPILRSGMPYLGNLIPTDGRVFRIPSPQREMMLASLAGVVETIDGRPYVKVQVSGDCGVTIRPSTCTAELVGQPAGGARASDWWTLVSTADTNWRSVVPADGRSLTGVPRPLLRAAEWSARHDPDALDRIRQYETCCSAAWTPSLPGQITIEYWRACRLSVEPPFLELADTGCNDSLAITVDVGPGTIVSIEEFLAGAKVVGP